VARTLTKKRVDMFGGWLSVNYQFPTEEAIEKFVLYWFRNFQQSRGKTGGRTMYSTGVGVVGASIELTAEHQILKEKWVNRLMEELPKLMWQALTQGSDDLATKFHDEFLREAGIRRVHESIVGAGRVRKTLKGDVLQVEFIGKKGRKKGSKTRRTKSRVEIIRKAAREKREARLRLAIEALDFQDVAKEPGRKEIAKQIGITKRTLHAWLGEEDWMLEDLVARWARRTEEMEKQT
jgi:hypothetical protein